MIHLSRYSSPGEICVTIPIILWNEARAYIWIAYIAMNFCQLWGMNLTEKTIVRYQIYLSITGYILKHRYVLNPVITPAMSSILLPMLFDHVLELLSYAAELTKQVDDDYHHDICAVWKPRCLLNKLLIPTRTRRLLPTSECT